MGGKYNIKNNAVTYSLLSIPNVLATNRNPYTKSPVIFPPKVKVKQDIMIKTHFTSVSRPVGLMLAMLSENLI